MKTHRKQSNKKSPFIFLALFLFIPSLAQAHPNHGPATGLCSGLAHPLTGLDHLCAMIAVGLWAVQLGGRARWAVPLAFVSVMSLGATLGQNALGLPFVEQGIVASVLILGILIAVAVRLPLGASVTVVGLFALFHGYAHGAEMPGNISGFSYEIGFIAATASLHLCGIGLGLAAQRFATEKVVRHCGGLIAVCGLYLAVVL